MSQAVEFGAPVMRCVVLALALGASLNVAVAQETVTVKSAIVALAAQRELRADFEEGLVAKALERLQNLVVTNINGIRPAIREHLGLPPLE